MELAYNMKMLRQAKNALATWLGFGYVAFGEVRRLP
jgi:hypothetical protein